jgi:recombination protein RecA
MSEKLELGKKYLQKLMGTGLETVTRSRFSTGHPFIDHLTGGGFPFGQNIELSGEMHSGKSTLALTAAAEVQKLKHKTGLVLYLDYEESFSKEYFESLGGLTDEEHLLVISPSTGLKSGEEGFRVMSHFIENDIADLCIVDSLAAMVPEKEADVEKEEDTFKGRRIGLHAQMISQCMSGLVPKMAEHETCVIWINQVRLKFDKHLNASITTPGGNAFKHYTTIQLLLEKRKREYAKKYDVIENALKDEVVAHRVDIKSLKNKTGGTPYGSVPVTLTTMHGFDREKDLFSLAVNHGLVKKAGSWFILNGIGIERRVQGEVAALNLVKQNPEVYKKLEAAALNILRTKKGDDTAVEYVEQEEFDRKKVQLMDPKDKDDAIEAIMQEATNPTK